MNERIVFTTTLTGLPLSEYEKLDARLAARLKSRHVSTTYNRETKRPSQEPLQVSMTKEGVESVGGEEAARGIIAGILGLEVNDVT